MLKLENTEMLTVTKTLSPKGVVLQSISWFFNACACRCKVTHMKKAAKLGSQKITMWKQITSVTGISWAWWIGPTNPVCLGLGSKPAVGFELWNNSHRLLYPWLGGIICSPCQQEQDKADLW